ncbi:MAG: adenylate/guanylate cyclase domain-containing protein, partial [Elusimicrobia bacterium]|nr:adenylate/guanylate cyclase domain-containing protein [Elusimicrobiota bacterium]
YRFIVYLSAALALPAPALALASLDAAAVARTALMSAVEGYFLAYLCILCLEPYLFSDAMPALYEGPELFRRKKGATLSIRLKLWLMVASLVIAPMLLVSATLVQHHSSLAAIWPVPVTVVVVSLCYIIGYLEVLYQSITAPLAELVRKMELVADGDFSVRTSILSDDELGRIKGHFNEMVEGLAQRERIKDTFGKFLSVEVARRLIADGDIELGGEDIEATILFSDIRGFTTLSEAMSAKAVVSFLNAYFAHITEPIMGHGGFINKFIGDAVMGVFAPQFGSKLHVDDALNAALGMRAKLAEFNAKGLMPETVSFGVGIHTGPLVAGNVGTEKRMEYTLIGDTVNIASRIEGENKALGSTILISGDAYDRLSPDLRSRTSFERHDNIRIRGKKKTLTLYRVL